jgi:hypothetical protein
MAINPIKWDESPKRISHPLFFDWW